MRGDRRQLRAGLRQLAVAGSAAHEPWLHPQGYAHGYPRRIIDHAEERREALARLDAVLEPGTVLRGRLYYDANAAEDLDFDLYGATESDAILVWRATAQDPYPEIRR